jgi:hypothetical protein
MGSSENEGIHEHPHSSRRFLESLDCTDILRDRDARAAESRCNRCRYIFIPQSVGCGACLEELDSRAKCVEDRGHLHPSCASANDQVPVRTLARAARLIREARQLSEYGIGVSEPGRTILNSLSLFCWRNQPHADRVYLACNNDEST